MLRTFALAAATLATAATGCVSADDELADGEEAWILALRPIADRSETLPACDRTESSLELRMHRDADGRLLAIYTPGTDQRFDTYSLDESDPELLLLTATQELSSGDVEQWQFTLAPDRAGSAFYGFATQRVLVNGQGVCDTLYTADVAVAGR